MGALHSEEDEDATSGVEVDFGDLIAEQLPEETEPEADQEARELPTGPALPDAGDPDDPEWDPEPQGMLAELDVGRLVSALPELAPDSELALRMLEEMVSGLVHENWESLGEEPVLDERAIEDALGLPQATLESFEVSFDDGSAEHGHELLGAWTDVVPLEHAGDLAPRVAATPWSCIRVPGVAAASGLALLDERLVVAGAELVSLARSDSAAEGSSDIQHARAPHSLISVVPWHGGEVLCASSAGSLYTHSPARGFRAVTELHRRLGLATDAAVRWQLSALRLGGEWCVAALSDSGRLILAGAGGRLRPQLRRALVLGRGAPLVVVPRGEERPALRRLEDNTGKWSEAPLGIHASVTLDADSLLCCQGELMALAHPQGALWLSRDCGRHFQRIAGCSNVSALAFGSAGGVQRLFVAESSYQPAAELLCVDPLSGSVEHIATLDAEKLAAPAAELEDWSVHVLAWDGLASVLWVAGGFGLVRVAPQL